MSNLQKAKDANKLVSQLREVLLTSHELDEMQLSLLAKLWRKNLFKSYMGEGRWTFQDFLDDVGVPLKERVVKAKILLREKVSQLKLDMSTFKVRDENLTLRILNHITEETKDMWVGALTELTAKECRKLYNKEVRGIDQMTCSHEKKVEICTHCQVRVYGQSK